MEAAKEKLVQLENEQVQAFNSADVGRILGYFDSQLVGFSSTRHARLQGLDSLRETFEYYLHEADKVEYQVSEPEVQMLGDAAVVTFYWLVTLHHDGRRREIEGRGSHVYAKRDGDWKIVHEHFSRAHHGYEQK
jgi:ketosteroid isomerase-like protein